MAVPTTFADLSTTIGSNSPSGSDNVFPDLDNYIRALAGMLASVYANSGNGWTSPYLPAANPSYTGTLTGGTGVVNLGTNQFYKDSSGNVGIGRVPGVRLDVAATSASAAKFENTSGLGCNIALLDTGFAAGIGCNNGALLFFANGATSERARFDTSGNYITVLNTSSPTLNTNGQMVLALTSDTNLRISVRGSDGVTRSANLTLA